MNKILIGLAAVILISFEIGCIIDTCYHDRQSQYTSPFQDKSIWVNKYKDAGK